MTNCYISPRSLVLKKTGVLTYALLPMVATHVLARDNSSQNPSWGYSGEHGAKNWATLSADYYACSGKNQSPINLTGFIESDLTPIEINYKAGGNRIVNNGHTVQVNYEKGSSISIDNMSFNLLQFHFHAPSENHINGKSYPMEAHFVHSNKDGDLAVIAVLFEAGNENSVVKQAWAAMPKQAGEKNTLSTAVDANGILPNNKDYFRFNGSLTTPPCSEGVRWFVLKEIQTASSKQIEAFSSVLHEPNNRPIQPLNARVILK